MTRRLLVGVWTGIAVQVAGQLVDLRWHLTHRGFETASDQLEAHWLLWIGELVILIVAAVGARQVPSSWYTGYRLLLLAVVFLALSEGWHFWEHYHLRDPAAPHVLLAIGKAAVVVAAISATIVSRRGRVGVGSVSTPG